MAATVFTYNPNAIPSNADPAAVHLLAGCDTIHDIKEEPAGRVTSVAWNGGVYSAHLAHLNGLINSIRLPFPIPGGATSWLTAASGGTITASSSVEHQTVADFENRFPNELNKNLTVKTTYKAILDQIAVYTQQGIAINEAIYNAGNDIVGLNNILDVEVEPGAIFEAAYSTTDKLYIALFMLNFFFPPNAADRADNSRFPTYMTFDAGSKIPSKLFGPLDQVINLVTPLNIADSSTATSHLLAGNKGRKNGVKNKYEFPVDRNSTNLVAGLTGYKYTSNISTFGKFRFIIPMPVQPYTETTKHDFTIRLYGLPQPPQPPQLVSQIKFDDQHKNGPGLAYLADLIGNNASAVAGNGMADLRAFYTAISLIRGMSTIPNISDILLDIKRGGDWEQCNAAYIINKYSHHNSTGRVILCTLDQLCALYSRCLGQNTILHYNTRLTLYRFISAANPEMLAAQAAALDQARQAAALDQARQAAELVRLRDQALADKRECVNGIVAALTELLPKLDHYISIIHPENDGAVYKIIAWIKRQLLTVLRNKIRMIIGMPIDNDERLLECVSQIELWLGVDLTRNTVYKIIESITNFNPTSAGKGAQKLGEYNVTALITTAKPMMQKLLLENGGFGVRRIAGAATLDVISNELLDVLKGYLLTIRSLVVTNDMSPTDQAIEKSLLELAMFSFPSGMEPNSENNSGYIAELQWHINNFNGIVFAGGGRTKIQRTPKKSFKGGALEDNLIADYYNELTTNFISLCVDISEISNLKSSFTVRQLLNEDMFNEEPEVFGDSDAGSMQEDHNEEDSGESNDGMQEYQAYERYEKPYDAIPLLLNFFNDSFSTILSVEDLLPGQINHSSYMLLYALVSFIYFDYESINDKYKDLFDKMVSGGAPNMAELQLTAEFFIEIIHEFNGTEFLPKDYMNYVGTEVLSTGGQGYYVSIFRLVIQCFYSWTKNGQGRPQTPLIRSTITPDGLILRLFVFLKNYLQFVVARVAQIKATNGRPGDFGYNTVLMSEFDVYVPLVDPAVPPRGRNSPPPSYNGLYSKLNQLVTIDGRMNNESTIFENVFNNSSVIIASLLYAILNPTNPGGFVSAILIIRGGRKSKRVGKKTLKNPKSKLSKNKKKNNNKRRRTIKSK